MISLNPNEDEWTSGWLDFEYSKEKEGHLEDLLNAIKEQNI